MAGGNSYRGLTIKIGADATQLGKELQRVQAAANSTQADFRKLDKALKLDPKNTGLMSERIRAMGTNAVSTASKIQIMRRAVTQASKSLTNFDKGMTFTDLSERLKKSGVDVAVYAQQCREQYNSINATISKYRQAVLEANEISTEGHGTGWIEKQYTELVKNTDVAKKYAAQIQRINQLSSRHAEAQAKLTDADQLEMIRKTNIEIASEEAKLKSLSSGFVQAKQSYQEFAEQSGLKAAEERVDSYTASAKRAREEAAEFSKAMKVDPTNYTIAAKRMETIKYSMQENEKEVAALAEKARVLSQTINDNGWTRVNASLAELSRREKAAGEAAGAAAADYNEQAGKVTDLTMKLRELRAQRKAFNDGLKMGDGFDARAMEADIKATSEALKQAKVEAKAFGQSMKEAQNDYNASVTNRNLAETEQQLEKTRVAADAYNAKITGGAKDLSKRSYMMRSIGMSLYSTITPAATMAAYGVVNATDQIDAAYRDMRKTVDGTDEQFEALKKQAEEFSQTHVTSADQILEIQAIGGQLGVATDDLGKFAETVSNLDTATNIDAETAAEDLGKLGSITKMTADDYEHFGDSLVRLGNNFPGQESDIMNITTRFAGMAETVGMSTTDMLAWATAATATGQKSEAAGSAMQRFIGYLESSVASYETSLKSGQKKTIAFADVAGVSSKKFAEDWKKNPTVAMKEFLTGLAKLKEKGESVDGWLQTFMSKNVRDRQLIEGLVNSYGKYTDAQGKTAKGFSILDDALDQSAAAWKKGGDAANEANKKAEGFSGQLAIMKHNAQLLGEAVGESFAPAMGNANKYLESFVDAYKNIPNEGKGLIDVAGIGAIASGPIMTVFGTALQGIQTIKKGIDDTTIAFMQSEKGLNKYGKAVNRHNSIAKKFGGTQISAGKAMEAVSDAAVLSSSAMGNNGKAMQKGAKLARGMALGSRALGLAAGGLKTLLVGLAIGGVTYLADSYIKAKQEEEKYNAALQNSTSGLNSVQAAARDAANAQLASSKNTYEQAQSIDQISQKADSLKDSNKQLAQSGSDMADNWRNQWTSLDTSFAQAESAMNTMIRLHDRVKNGAKLTATEQEELNSAVRQYNTITGKNIKVKNPEKGTFSEPLKEIKEYIAEYEKLSKVKAYQGQIDEAQARKNVLEGQTASAKKAMDDANKQLENYQKSIHWDNMSPEVQKAYQITPEYQKYASAVQTATDAYNGLKIQLDGTDAALANNESALAGVTSGLDEAVKKSNNYKDAAINAGVGTADFAGFLANLGVTTKQVKADSDSMANGLGKVYSKMAEGGLNASDVAGRLKNVGVSAKDLSTISGSSVSKMVDGFAKLKESGKLSFNGLIADMKKMGVEGKTLNGISASQWAAIVSAYDGSKSSIQSIIDKVKQLKGIAVDPAKVTVTATDNGTIAKVKGLVIDLDHMKVNGKKFHVTDDGTIKTASGHVINLNNMKIDRKKFHVTDDGTILDENNKVIDLDKKKVKNKKFKVKADGADKAKKDVDSVNKSTSKKSTKKVEVKEKGSEKTKKKLDSVDKSTSKGSEKKVTFKESGYESVKNKISELSGNETIATKTINFHYKTTGKKPKDATNAYGGILKSSGLLDGAFKARSVYEYQRAHNMLASHHADGGIVNTPTYTRAGWVGEAGAEAIIPLDNKKYVRPFAKAVASQMQGGGGGSTVVNNYSINGLSFNPTSDEAQVLQQIAERVTRKRRA